MNNFLINFLRLTRPLSNVKNIALIVLAFYFSKTAFSLPLFLWAIVSSSLVCSAFYAFNTLSDVSLDKDNENKKHYLKAINYFGGKKSFVIFISLLFLGLFTGYFINLYFFICLLLLSLTDFLYSFKYTRLKERLILDILFGAFLTFFFRFLAFWFVFSYFFPPVLVLAGLIFAKSGGYFLYKSLDAPYLLNKKVKNSVTIISSNAKVIISATFFIFAFVCFALLCLNSYFKIGLLGVLPLRFLIIAIFAIPPIIVIYLSFLNKIKISVKKLRTAGYIYWIIVLIILAPFL